MNKITLIILLLVNWITIPAHSQDYNPIIPDNLADPTVMQFGDTFYLYATSDVGDLKTDLSFSGNPVVWKSKDFVNWSFEGICFQGVDWSKNRYWAPGRVILKDGRYYLFFTSEGATHVAISDHPEGPFHFANGPEKFTGKEKDSMVAEDIDGCPFVDDNGEAYLFWRLRKAARLTSDLLHQKGPSITIPTKWTSYSEGPFMIKRNGIYYYFYTLGGYGDYQYAYQISDKSPLGPFVTPVEDVILTTNLKEKIWGPGHGFAFKLNNSDDWIFAYLEYGIGGTSRQVYAARMEFNPDGTIKPILLDRHGVGPLSKNNQPEPIDLSHAIASASSIREPLTVQPRRLPNDVQLFVHLPEVLPSRIHEFVAGNAIDNSNFTEWWAAPEDSQRWWQVDLGVDTKVERCEIFFAHPTMGHACVVEKSLDGKSWQTALEEKSRVIRSPHDAGNIGIVRFLRIRIIEGTPGIWEVKLY